MTTTVRNTKTYLIAGIGLIAAIWIGIIAALVIFRPALAAKAAIVAAGAGATELILYAGAAWFGVSAFKRLRNRLRRK